MFSLCKTQRLNYYLEFLELVVFDNHVGEKSEARVDAVGDEPFSKAPVDEIIHHPPRSCNLIMRIRCQVLASKSGIYVATHLGHCPGGNCYGRPWVAELRQRAAVQGRAIQDNT